jgi:hypothetical protein
VTAIPGGNRRPPPAPGTLAERNLIGLPRLGEHRDNQDPESSRAWQLTRSRDLIEPHGGVIVVEYFDVDDSRSIPWQRRPYATALLAELRNPSRGFDAVVIGEPHRAFSATSPA